MLSRRAAVLALPAAGALLATLAACSRDDDDGHGDESDRGPEALDSVSIALVAPPNVHAHDQIAKHPPRIVKFRMTTESKTIVVDDAGTIFHAMTFNGTMPGPTMVVHQGDFVE